MPSLERITDVIRRKKSLFDRKQHETALRVLARQTAVRYSHLGPPPSASADAPKPPSAPPISPPRGTRSAAASTNKRGRNEDDRGADGDGAGDRRKQHEFECNQRALRELELPALDSSDLGVSHQPPRWLRNLRIEVRIVDYLWQGCATSRLFVSYLRHLGCDVIFTDDRQQIGLACGFVAARTSTDLCVSDDWRACGVSRAMEQDPRNLGTAI